MDRYKDIKRTVLAKKGKLNLGKIASELEELVKTSNSLAPFEFKLEEDFLFILCPIPKKHNFLIRRNKNKPYLVKVVHDFPQGFEDQTQFCDDMQTIKDLFSTYLTTIQNYINKKM